MRFTIKTAPSGFRRARKGFLLFPKNLELSPGVNEFRWLEYAYWEEFSDEVFGWYADCWLTKSQYEEQCSKEWY